MRPTMLMVVDVRSQYSPQRSLVEDDHMVQTLSANRPDQPFHMRILPRTLWCVSDLFDAPSLPHGPERAFHRRRRDRAAEIIEELSPREMPLESPGRYLRPSGAFVTLKCTMRRRPCASTTKTNSTPNVSVGTTTKSTVTSCRRWFQGTCATSVTAVCGGGHVLRGRRLQTSFRA